MDRIRLYPVRSSASIALPTYRSSGLVAWRRPSISADQQQTPSIFVSRFPRLLYAGTRRLALLDVTVLMHGFQRDLVSTEIPKGCRPTFITPQALTRLKQKGSADPQIGDFESVEGSHKSLAALFDGPRLVSFAWFASDWLSADNNFSRARHLGTSIRLPADTRFLFNLWTDPRYRGRGLAGGLLHWAAGAGSRKDLGCENGFDGLASMVDWGNAPSRRVLQRLGMQPLGSITRMGRGPFQLSLLPSAAERLGLGLATDTPGIKFAL